MLAEISLAKVIRKCGEHIVRTGARPNPVWPNALWMVWKSLAKLVEIFSLQRGGAADCELRLFAVLVHFVSRRSVGTSAISSLTWSDYFSATVLMRLLHI